MLQARRDWSDPIAVKGPDSGYRLEAGGELPPLLFDDDQAVALAAALQVATTGSATIGEDALGALNTVRQVMPSRLRHRIYALAVTAVRRPADTGDQVDSRLLMSLGAAAHAREILRFDYGPPGGLPSTGTARRGDRSPACRRGDPLRLRRRGGVAGPRPMPP